MSNEGIDIKRFNIGFAAMLKDMFENTRREIYRSAFAAEPVGAPDASSEAGPDLPQRVLDGFCANECGTKIVECTRDCCRNQATKGGMCPVCDAEGAPP